MIFPHDHQLGLRVPTGAEATNVSLNSITLNVGQLSPYKQPVVVTHFPPCIRNAQAINFMRLLCDKQDLVESLLQVLGSGNWMMGGKMAPNKYDEEDSLLSRYLGNSPP